MTLLISGALSSCNKQVDYQTTIEEIYSNDTNHSVVLIGFISETDNIKTYNWEIASNSSISFEYVLPESFAMTPKICDSLKIVFDDEKQLWYKNGEGLFIPENKEDISKHGTRYYCTITKQMYDSASFK